MSVADHRFVHAVQKAMEGRGSTTLGENLQQQERERATACARRAVSGAALSSDEVACLARQYLRVTGQR